ncbi:MAG: multiubiquitin domain-containing protein [Chitinophagaceae bacterium]|nr:multiubiquitin domain-containing protein [Chitinophagaceae bacterium]
MKQTTSDNIEVIDLQEYAKTDRKVPVGKQYQTLVDQVLVVFNKEKVTGREVLIKAGKKPPECFSLYIKRKGCEPDRISLDELVDLTSPGVEIFSLNPGDFLLRYG